MLTTDNLIMAIAIGLLVLPFLPIFKLIIEVYWPWKKKIKITNRHGIVAELYTDGKKNDYDRVMHFANTFLER
ncbi:hypothetical protein [Chitinophaga tropicalis]|uniref:Uncharacterized protein n=1 Tax=Chitinophaga tropicalis TaxID=2683588 RepID=A0A7K1UBL6_9BACT|nr:hypothetical protein [Chitinophaga tropicalis]MVT11781.1 hypothetical protein [Chitinophaga tropicalis]